MDNEIKKDEDGQEEMIFDIPEDEEVPNNKGANDLERTLLDIAEGVSEIEITNKNKVRHHPRTLTCQPVSTLIKRYKKGKLSIPICQRLYVWNEMQRQLLLDSMKRDIVFGALIICVREDDEIEFVTDGLQRLTSMMLLVGDKNLSEEDRKEVLEYQVPLITVYEMNDEEIKIQFARTNSGVALAKIMTEISLLPNDLSNAILKLSGNELFKKYDTTATFSKNSHNVFITANTVLAAAGVEIGTNKAKHLCKRILKHEKEVFDSLPAAEALLDRLSEILDLVAPDIRRRSMNANFMSVLMYVMSNTEYTNESIINLINSIFECRYLPRDYSCTVSSGATDEEKCKDRYDYMIKYLENPIESTDFQKWISSHKDKVFNDGDMGKPVDFAEFSIDELRSIYLAEKKDDTKTINKIVGEVYARLENETDVA